jgi:hypothetical protein
MPKKSCERDAFVLMSLRDGTRLHIAIDQIAQRHSSMSLGLAVGRVCRLFVPRLCPIRGRPFGA